MANVHGLGGSRKEDKNPFARPPQANGIVEPNIDYQSCVEIKSQKELDAALKRATQRMTVVYFFTHWYPSCFALGAAIGRFSAKYPLVNFLRIDCEALSEIATSDRYRINALPYVLFIKKQSIEQRLSGESLSDESCEQQLLRLTGGAAHGGGGHRLGSQPAAAEEKNKEKKVGDFSPALSQLLQMGFDEKSATLALQQVGDNVEAAAAYLIDHPLKKEKLDTFAHEKSAEENGEKSDENGAHRHQALCNRCKRQIVGIRHKCLSCADFDLCDSCFKMRIMWHDEEHDFADFAEEMVLENHEEKKVLFQNDEKTDEKVEKLKKMMEEKRQMREEDGKRQERENELKRRVEAKNTLEQRRKFEQEKVRIDLEKTKREKERAEQHKRKVLEKIRRERGEKMGVNVKEEEKVTVSQPAVKKEVSSTCQVVLRGREGTLTWSGPSTESVQTVAAWASKELGGKPVILVASHPRVVFADGKELLSLLEAGLVPRGMLLIQ